MSTYDVLEQTGVERRNFSQSGQLQKRSHSLIPGGAHTYAKGDDQYPVRAPGFIVRGFGCSVWDADGNEFIEYGMGMRAVTLGHAFRAVSEAAARQLELGINFTRPSPLEVECAESLLDLLANAEMVKFSKNGSDVTTAALRLARAYTGRDMVLACADHPFFSIDDWFVGTTAMNSGTLTSASDVVKPFRYNDVASVEAQFAAYPGRIACLIMEAETTVPPRDGFLERVQALCKTNGAVFILDEIITGFRWHLNGAQSMHRVIPDLCTFGKALANGFSLSALAGKKAIMELGGLQHARDRVFLLSTTHGAETHSLAAAIATMEIYRQYDVVGHLWHQGERLRQGLQEAARVCGVADYFEVLGRPCNLVYVTRDADKQPSQALRALFLQEIIERGILAPSFVISFSHQDDHVARTIDAVGEALTIYRKALEDGVEKYLVGRPLKPVFRRHN